MRMTKKKLYKHPKEKRKKYAGGINRYKMARPIHRRRTPEKTE